ncbi:hypothetical protein KB20921_32590 [Edwardsiella ictaluri]|nr:hypothetical protein KH20906_32490 [Edwardsiella ictaluri]BEI03998.1 hypothetical protein KB20921_32590 [Edwardsiella ictaluri]BEI07453.1 hypothetical protein KH201010_32390 [Edwardsiella ictaluri]BEI10925.1 hypothetical protein STU22726_32560 [Edwardsiella ictaluri]BEI14405.1 hypothetical protein STU22816_32580 [Edwardsiella ictaluri]
MKLGVSPDRIYTDKGFTNQALAAVHNSDTLIVPKLNCLARPLPDARQVADAL